MIEIKRILCPIDFSDYSRRALDHAVAMARWYDSTITLLHVCSLVPVPAYAPEAPVLQSMVLTPADRDELLASMKRFAEDEAGSDLPIQCETCEGTVTAAILAQAKAMASDLIVMGTHGRSGFERLVLGSVTEKVLRKAACPVLSVPRHVRDAVPAPPVLFKNILCAIDFSDCSINALNYARSLAKEAAARLTVLHVIELLPELPPGSNVAVQVWPRNVSEYIAEVEQDRRALLKAAVPESVRAYCGVETLLANGTPYREILRVAAEQKSDLVVIGIHGRGAADLLFFGSTAQHVVRQATCPVLTLRSDDPVPCAPRA
jgi:nucleotide-binding universal stress UspA family protein